ncbi:hypothetical protein B0H13DRAFT_2671537 [Mycena leptocephala]|nr:hypothetical protein B0H13DRAFT_2671537 [Mycena leptocephala]
MTISMLLAVHFPVIGPDTILLAVAPALGRRGAAHPDAAAVRSACAFAPSRRTQSLVFAHSNVFAIFHFHPPASGFRVLRMRHLLAATRTSTSSCCASPHVLRIGSGARSLARAQPIVVKTETLVDTVSPRIAAPRRVVHTTSGGECAPWDESSHDHDCPARCDCEVRELERGYQDPSPRPLFSGPRAPTVLRRRDESAVSPHRAARAAWCLEDGRRATSGENEGEGAELAHTHDWPAHRACEARELERDGEVFRARARLSSPDLLALGFLRPDYDDGDWDLECK